MRIAIEVKSKLDHSDALNAHIEREVDKALHTHKAYVTRVRVNLQDANGPRGGPDDKVARITVALRGSMRAVASATAGDIYVSVARAAERAKNAVARRVERRTGTSKRTGGRLSRGGRNSPTAPRP